MNRGDVYTIISCVFYALISALAWLASVWLAVATAKLLGWLP